MLKNASGRYCYRYATTDSWRLSDKARHDQDLCAACIVAKEGPLPVGAHTWKVAVDGKFVDGTLTVGLLVRPPLPSACASLFFVPAPRAAALTQVVDARQSDADMQRVEEEQEAKAAKALAEVQKVDSLPTPRPHSSN